MNEKPRSSNKFTLEFVHPGLKDSAFEIQAEARLCCTNNSNHCPNLEPIVARYSRFKISF